MRFFGIFSVFSVLVLTKALQFGKDVAEDPRLERQPTSNKGSRHRDDITRPNILLITTDQQRLDSISAYANDRGQKKSGIASPHLDVAL